MKISHIYTNPMGLFFRLLVVMALLVTSGLAQPDMPKLSDTVGDYTLKLEVSNELQLQTQEGVAIALDGTKIDVPDKLRVRIEAFRLFPTFLTLGNDALARKLVHSTPITYRKGQLTLDIPLQEDKQSASPGYYLLTGKVDARQIQRSLRNNISKEVRTTLGSDCILFYGKPSQALLQMQNEIKVIRAQIIELEAVSESFMLWYSEMQQAVKALPPASPDAAEFLTKFKERVHPDFVRIADMRTESFRRNHRSVMKENFLLCFKIHSRYFQYIEAIADNIFRSGIWGAPGLADGKFYFNRMRLDLARSVALNVHFYLDDMRTAWPHRFAAWEADPTNTREEREMLQTEWKAALKNAAVSWSLISEAYTKEFISTITNQLRTCKDTKEDGLSCKKYTLESLPTMTNSGLKGKVTKYISELQTLLKLQSSYLDAMDPNYVPDENETVGDPEELKRNIQTSQKTAASLHTKIVELLLRPQDHLPTPEELEALGDAIDMPHHKPEKD